jgi:hypothetical protein
MKSLVVALCAGLIGLGGPVVAQDTPIPRVSGDTAAAPGAAGALAQHSAEVEVAFWESVKDSDDPMLFLAYLEQFPDGAFRVIARNRLDDLWDRALRAFALLEEMGVSVDTPPGSGVAPPPASAPPPVVVTPAPAPAPPSVIVTPAPAPPPVIVRPASPPNPASFKTIRNTQNQLRKHGCYTGAVDGIWGDASRKAMRKFNRRAGTSFKVAQPTFKALNHMRDLSKLGVRVCR